MKQTRPYPGLIGGQYVVALRQSWRLLLSIGKPLPILMLPSERGKKRVYLAQDTLLDREVAFVLIKTEGWQSTSDRTSGPSASFGRSGQRL